MRRASFTLFVCILMVAATGMSAVGEEPAAPLPGVSGPGVDSSAATVEAGFSAATTGRFGLSDDGAPLSWPEVGLSAAVDVATMDYVGPDAVPDVYRQFLSLDREGDALGWWNDGSDGAPDPSKLSHFQGVVRYHPGRGESPVFYATLNSDKHFGYLEVIELASRGTDGERLGSNLGPLLEDDTFLDSLRFDGSVEVPSDCDPQDPVSTECDVFLSYRHPSGLSIVDDVLLMSMSYATDVMPDSLKHVLVLFDLKGPDGHLKPHPIRAVRLPYPAGTLSALDLGWTVVLFANNSGIRGLEIYMTRTLDPVTGEEVFTNDLRDPNIFVAHPACIQYRNPTACNGYAQELTQGDGIDLNGVVEGWAKGEGAYQGTTLLRQTDGQLYLMAFRNDDYFAGVPGNNQATLWEVSEVTQDNYNWPVRYGLKAVKKLRDFCWWNPSRCNFHAAANAYVSPTGELIVYSVPHDDQDRLLKKDYVKFAEFPAQNDKKCLGLVPTIVGTDGDDNLTGTAGSDVIVGLGGNDTIDAGGGNDLVCAGSGNDIVLGGAGRDKLIGGPGNDLIDGQRGKDRLVGNGGRDRLFGRGGNDKIYGGGGRDVIKGGGGDDTAFARDRRTDRLYGGPGTDTAKVDAQDRVAGFETVLPR